MKDKPYSLSVKVLVFDRQGRCLLLKRSEDSKNNPGKWDFPGGKIDACETFNDALVREIREETGLDVTIDRVAGCAESESPKSRIAYLIMSAKTDSDAVVLSEEHSEYLWVKPSDLASQDLCPAFRDFARAQASGV
jgi:8-oxo-dGTP diphosphatase